MKKFAVILGILGLFCIENFAFADEIIDALGKVTTCNITGIENGFIEYQKDGMTRTFTREQNSAIFNDYVDVQTNLLDKKAVVRYTGQILVKDMQEIIIQTNEGKMRIPWYKVRLVGVYKPEWKKIV